MNNIEDDTKFVFRHWSYLNKNKEGNTSKYYNTQTIANCPYKDLSHKTKHNFAELDQLVYTFKAEENNT